METGSLGTGLRCRYNSSEQNDESKYLTKSEMLLCFHKSKLKERKRQFDVLDRDIAKLKQEKRFAKQRKPIKVQRFLTTQKPFSFHQKKKPQETLPELIERLHTDPYLNMLAAEKGSTEVHKLDHNVLDYLLSKLQQLK